MIFPRKKTKMIKNPTKKKRKEKTKQTLQNDEGFIQSNYKNYFITLLTVSDAAIIRIKCIGKLHFS